MGFCDASSEEEPQQTHSDKEHDSLVHIVDPREVEVVCEVLLQCGEVEQPRHCYHCHRLLVERDVEQSGDYHPIQEGVERIAAVIKDHPQRTSLVPFSCLFAIHIVQNGVEQSAHSRHEVTDPMRHNPFCFIRRHQNHVRNDDAYQTYQCDRIGSKSMWNMILNQVFTEGTHKLLIQDAVVLAAILEGFQRLQVCLFIYDVGVGEGSR